MFFITNALTWMKISVLNMASLGMISMSMKCTCVLLLLLNLSTVWQMSRNFSSSNIRQVRLSIGAGVRTGQPMNGNT